MVNNKIKIAHVRTSHGVFGAEQVILGLLKSIDKHKFDVSVILVGSEPGLNKDFSLAIHAIDIKVKSFLFVGRLDLAGVKELRRYILKQNIDLVHCHDFKANFYGLVATLGTRVKRVATHHGSTKDSFLLKLYLGVNEYFFLRFFHRVIAVSRQLKKEFWARLLGTNVRFIPNGIDTGFFNKAEMRGGQEPDLMIPIGKRVIGIIGRLFPDKGHEYLFKAFALLKEEFSDLILLVVGDGPEAKRLQSLSNEMGISEIVLFCGVRQDMKKVYEALDLFVMPSIREGMPMALLEAMLARVPVVGTRVGEMTKLLSEGKRGRAVNPCDHISLAKEIKFLLLNSEEANRMAQNAYLFINNGNSSVSMARRTENLYREIGNYSARVMRCLIIS